MAVSLIGGGNKSTWRKQQKFNKRNKKTNKQTNKTIVNM
jgi:hypothetical protein